MAKQSNSKTTQTQTMTPTNPSWVDSLVQPQAANVGALSGMDPHSFIAGPDPLQSTAGANAGTLTGTPWAYDASTDVARGVAQSSAPDIASLMNPFKGAFDNRVINPALAAFDQNAGMTRASNDLNLARSGAFGGSGAALTKSLTDQGLALSRGQLQGGLLSDQFKTALGGATSQAGDILGARGQQLGAAGLISQNANDYGATQRADIGTQAGIGSILQGINQAQTGAPLTVAQQLAQITGSLPLNLFHGGTTTGTGSGTTTDFGMSREDAAKTAAALALFFG